MPKGVKKTKTPENELPVMFTNMIKNFSEVRVDLAIAVLSERKSLLGKAGLLEQAIKILEGKSKEEINKYIKDNS